MTAAFELLANLWKTDGHLKSSRLRRQLRADGGLVGGLSMKPRRRNRGPWTATCSTRQRTSRRWLGKIDEGFDIASGWRKHRWTTPSAQACRPGIANWLDGKASGIDLPDFLRTTIQSGYRGV